MRTQPRHFAYADLTEEEHAVVKRFAQREGLSVADFVRRCVNAYLLEVSDDDVPLIAEKRSRDRVAS